MISPQEYQRERITLMEEYESRVRTWLLDGGDKDLSEMIPFFRDGVVCPEVWFQEDNCFRPLFILKEVSLGINYIHELPQYLETWGYPRYFEFAENPFDDIRVGTFRQWRRIARLAKGLEQVQSKEFDCPYSELDLGFKDGGEVYTGDIEGYKSKQNCQRTSNPVYNSIMDRIAVMEIKKVGAGVNATSELSLATKFYSEHIVPFQDLICRQIKLIDPTVIICLGRESGACISRLLKDVKKDTGNRLWIDGYHHTRSSNEHFYEEPIAAYKKHLSKV